MKREMLLVVLSMIFFISSLADSRDIPTSKQMIMIDNVSLLREAYKKKMLDAWKNLQGGGCAKHFIKKEANQTCKEAVQMSGIDPAEVYSCVYSGDISPNSCPAGMVMSNFYNSNAMPVYECSVDKEFDKPCPEKIPDIPERIPDIYVTCAEGFAVSDWGVYDKETGKLGRLCSEGGHSYFAAFFRCEETPEVGDYKNWPCSKANYININKSSSGPPCCVEKPW